jgi:biotin transport system substrate-specific component
MSQSVSVHIQRRVSQAAIEVTIALLGGCFLATMSQVAVPLPFTPVALTMQTLALFLMAGVLGSKRASTSVIAYLAQGLCGLPVFAGGVANPLWFFDIKAGFWISFIVAAWIIGKLLEKQSNPSFFRIVSALSIGQAVIFAMGAAWLSYYVGFNKALLFGVTPFLSGAAIKIAVGALILKGKALISA